MEKNFRFVHVSFYIYIYIYIYISDKIKLLKKLYFNVSGRCPFVKNKNYKIEDASYIHSIT